MTYVLISLPFLVFAAAAWWRRARNTWRATAAVAAVLLGLTAVFDNLMIAAGLVGYGSAQNLGLYLGLVPLEDFCYPVFVCLVVAAFWRDDRP